MDALATLGACPLFEGIPQAELQGLVPHAALRHFARGAALFHEDDPANRIFIVVSGAVKVSRVRQGGEEMVLAFLTPGDVFGELHLFAAEPTRSGDAEALEDTECLSIALGPVRDLLTAHPQALARHVERMAAHIRRRDEDLAETAYHDIPGRVASRLLDLAARHGHATDKGLVIDVRISQRNLAAMVGASRENVNRALSSFAAQGLIRQERGVVTLLDPQRLRARV